jgi:hypothetical protein
LTITISPDEAKEIEAEAELSKAKVREMFAKYRPNQNNGDADMGASVSESIQQKFANYSRDSGKDENGSL